MNLGLAPMPEGKLHENDVQVLKAFGEKLKHTFSTNLAAGATISADNVRGKGRAFGPENLLDEDRYSYYASDDEITSPTLEIELQDEQTFDLIRLRENIKLGQRIDSIKIDIKAGDQWRELAQTTSIGANRLIKLAQPTTARQLRIRIYAPVAPALSDFALFLL